MKQREKPFALCNNESECQCPLHLKCKDKRKHSANKTCISRGCAWYLKSADMISNSVSIPRWKATLLSFSEAWGNLEPVNNVPVETQSNMYLKRNMKLINFSVSPCEIDGQRWHEGLEGTKQIEGQVNSIILHPKQCGGCDFLFNLSDYLILLSAISMIFFLPSALEFHLRMSVCVCTCAIMWDDFRINNK